MDVCCVTENGSVTPSKTCNHHKANNEVTVPLLTCSVTHFMF